MEKFNIEGISYHSDTKKNNNCLIIKKNRDGVISKRNITSEFGKAINASATLIINIPKIEFDIFGFSDRLLVFFVKKTNEAITDITSRLKAVEQIINLEQVATTAYDKEVKVIDTHGIISGTYAYFLMLNGKYQLAIIKYNSPVPLLGIDQSFEFITWISDDMKKMAIDKMEKSHHEINQLEEFVSKMVNLQCSIIGVDAPIGLIGFPIGTNYFGKTQIGCN